MWHHTLTKKWIHKPKCVGECWYMYVVDSVNWNNRSPLKKGCNNIKPWQFQAIILLKWNWVLVISGQVSDIRVPDTALIFWNICLWLFSVRYVYYTALFSFKFCFFLGLFLMYCFCYTIHPFSVCFSFWIGRIRCFKAWKDGLNQVSHT